METLLEQGPMPEETWLSNGLDYYKLTMSQLEYEKHPDATVTFTYKNRGEQRIMDYVNPAGLKERLDFIRERGWNPDEIEYIRSLRDSRGNQIFSDDYLGYIVSNPLPEVEVGVDPETDDITISSTGNWPLVTFWETVIMSEVSEMYFANLVRSSDIDLQELYAEGDRRFSEKTAYLAANPDIKDLEFGTRRRFSLRWHKHILERLIAECPDNLVGTSNVALSSSYDMVPKGTFAHELPMVYAGIADAQGGDEAAIRASHGQMLDDWIERYPDLGIALSDTFGTDFFLQDFNEGRARRYQGTRQDSGDPIAFGDKMLDHYRNLGIDPREHSIVFSDSLKISNARNTVAPLHQRFQKSIAHSFGIGTDGTNDLGFKDGSSLKALNQVMKATHVNGAETVKLSDDDGKHTGSETQVERYKKIFGSLVLAA